MSSTWREHVYALTGSIGSGKSTVLKIFRELGAYTVSADELARKAVEPGSHGLAQVSAAFGPKFILPDGTLNRKELGHLVFSDMEAKKRLESILHPLIQEMADQEATQAISSNSRVIIYEIPLLFEIREETAGFKGIIVVGASEQDLIARAGLRDGTSKAETISRYECQIPIAEKVAKADYVIENSGDLRSLRTKVESLYKELASLSKK